MTTLAQAKRVIGYLKLIEERSRTITELIKLTNNKNIYRDLKPTERAGYLSMIDIENYQTRVNITEKGKQLIRSSKTNGDIIRRIHPVEKIWPAKKVMPLVKEDGK